MDTEAKRQSMYINIIITQLICCVLIISSVLVMKYFFKGEFKEIKSWYIKNITNDTRISEVIE